VVVPFRPRPQRDHRRTPLLVLKPDRRQTPDRRQAWRGGRRASDRVGFAVSFVLAADEDLTRAGDGVGPIPPATHYAPRPAVLR
jgi:hypothetical protein